MDQSITQRIARTGFVAIIRKLYGDELLRLSDALYEGGARQIEVTFDQSDPDCLKITPESIASLKERHPDMDVGAGTVLTKEQVLAAKEAGATFIISPNADADIIQFTKQNGLASVPGAMTPSEVVAAFNAGADIVKLFPAGYLGTAYIKDLRAPISHIPLMATGGINPDNFESFLRAGCCSAGIGSFLSDKKLIAAGDWDAFRARARMLIDATERVLTGK